MVVGSNLTVDIDLFPLSSNNSATTAVTDGSHFFAEFVDLTSMVAAWLNSGDLSC